MREKCRFTVINLVMLFTAHFSYAQDTIKFETIRSVKDIPHATLTQKWMWPHRSIVYGFMKERIPNNDTSYYTSYKARLFSLTVPVSTLFINFKLRDGITANVLNFEPNNRYNIGIGINSRYVSFILNTGIAVNKSNNDIKGKTKYSDYQFNVYGKKSIVDLSLQTYKGFYVENANDFEHYRDTQTLPYEMRPDVSVSALSLNHYYVFNHKRFSYRSSFAFTERQKKSAGSILLGSYLALFDVHAKSSLVSNSFAPYFDTTADIRNAGIINFGLNLGYTYTMIMKKNYYATLSYVQGLGISKTATTRINNSKYQGGFRFSSKQNVRVAVGYNSANFFCGTMGIFDFYYFDDKTRSDFNYTSGKFRIFAGYRFSIDKQERKFLRRLNLIDYRI